MDWRIKPGVVGPIVQQGETSNLYNKCDNYIIFCLTLINCNNERYFVTAFCWAFSTIAALESVYCIDNELEVKLSVQDLIDNYERPLVFDKEGKIVVQKDEGGMPYDVLRWISNNGCVEENACLYTGMKQERNPNRKVLLFLTIYTLLFDFRF